MVSKKFKVGVVLFLPLECNIENQGIGVMLKHLILNWPRNSKVHLELIINSESEEKVCNYIYDSSSSNFCKKFSNKETLSCKLSEIVSSLEKKLSIFSSIPKRRRLMSRNFIILKLSYVILSKLNKLFLSDNTIESKIKNSRHECLFFTQQQFLNILSQVRSDQKYIIWFHDWLVLDFPQIFDMKYWNKYADQLKPIWQKANNIICHSEYVKNNHLSKLINLKGKKIPKVNVIYPGYYPLQTPKEIKAKPGNENNLIRDYVLNKYNNNFFGSTDQKERWRKLAGKILWTQLKYIMLSTAMREHKNCITVLKAFKLLKKRKSFDLKLVVTDLGLIEYNYIMDNNLQEDIVVMAAVPHYIHYILLQNAIMTIHPSPFEATLAAPFIQGNSVGTPCLITKVPTNTAVIPYQGNEEFYFEAYDVKELSEKILNMINNRESIAEKQAEIIKNHELLAKRSWKKVAQEFHDIIVEVATS